MYNKYCIACRADAHRTLQGRKRPRLDLGQARLRLGGGRSGIVGGNAEFLHQHMQLQICHQPGGGRGVWRIFSVSAGRGVYGRGAHDLGKGAAHLGFFAVSQKLFAHALFHTRVVDVFVYARERAEGLNQREGRLFAHARNARNVVGGVAHQAFHINQLARRNAVFFPHGGLVHHGSNTFAHRRARQQYARARPRKLQAVAVARGQHAGIAARGRGGGQCAENVVRFVSLARDHPVAKIAQQFLQNRQLRGQLLGHALALRLIARIHFVAEGGRAQIERNGHLVRLFLGLEPQQDI